MDLKKMDHRKKLMAYGLALNFIGTFIMIVSIFLPQNIGDSFIVSMDRSTGEYTQLGDIENRRIDAIGIGLLGAGFVLQLIAL